MVFWCSFLAGAAGCSESDQTVPLLEHLSTTDLKRSLFDPTPVSWAAASEDLRFSVGRIDEPADEYADALTLHNGHLVAVRFLTDGYAEWVWYLELARLPSGEWAPCSTLYANLDCSDLRWYGEGDLSGSVTVDSRDPRALRCRLDLRGEYAGGEPHDLSVSFLADPMLYPHELIEYLGHGLDESLGLLEP